MSIHYLAKDETRSEKIKALWADGISGPDIAERLGMTRNAVAGQIRRMGLYGANRPMSERMAAEIARKQEAAKVEASNTIQTRRRTLYRKTAAHVSDNLLDVFEGLKGNQCRWPIGEPADHGFHFCNGQKEPLASYCEHHLRIAFPGKKRKSTGKPFVLQNRGSR